MALYLATQTGPQAKVLVDTGTIQFPDIEQIVPGRWMRVGWEAFISMTAAMRTMTSPWDPSIPIRYSASFTKFTPMVQITVARRNWITWSIVSQPQAEDLP